MMDNHVLHKFIDNAVVLTLLREGGNHCAMKYSLAHFIRSAWTVVCLCALLERSAFAFSFPIPSPLHKQPYTAGVHLHSKIHAKASPCYQQKGQSVEEFKISSQIARLNAVAAKLRAEAAELEVRTRISEYPFYTLKFVPYSCAHIYQIFIPCSADR